ncbi:MAG: ABC transporter permease [Lachnospiraceae bacterium]|nr:ABC transporter permease [Lachnospiraceae bacterium]
MLENIRLSLRGIKAHKMRSVLTMLGVIIGIVSIIAIVSIVQGTNKQLATSLVGSGNNVVEVSLSKDGYPIDGSGQDTSGIYPVSQSALDSIEELPHVQGATAYNRREDYNVVFHQAKAMSWGEVVGVSNDYFETFLYKTMDGTLFAEDDYKSARKVAIIDQAAMKQMYDESEEAVGSIIEIKGEPFVVIGVVASANASEEEKEYESINDYYMYGSGGSQGNVFIPKSSWPIVYEFDEADKVGVKVDDTEQMAAVGKSASDVLNTYLTSMELQYAATNSSDYQEELKQLTNAITMMLVGIASLSLLVGGIGVMNIMLVSVTERTSEIGLKKALGAKRRTIMAQFLTESVVLTSVGGLIGIVLGIILAFAISRLAHLQFAISVPWIIISVLFSMGVGIIFGATPASKAAKLSPIEALRRE